MLDIRYKGLKLIPSKAAMQELMELGFTLEDCKTIVNDITNWKKSFTSCS